MTDQTSHHQDSFLWNDFCRYRSSTVIGKLLEFLIRISVCQYELNNVNILVIIYMYVSTARNNCWFPATGNRQL